MSGIAATPDAIDFRRRRLVLGAPLLLSACWLDDSSSNPSPTRLRAAVHIPEDIFEELADALGQ